MPNTTAYIGLGSNLGDRAGHLLLAVRGMMNAGLAVTRVSSIYETEPVDALTNRPLGGRPDGPLDGPLDREVQPLFLNMAAELAGILPPPEQLLARLLRIEYALGRRRSIPHEPHAARTIDLDLLLYGDDERQTDFLILPHPRLHLRRFVLTPLAELAPHKKHPVLHRTLNQLLATTADKAEVKLWHPHRKDER